MFRWLRTYNLLKRFPSIPQPGLQDPRTQHALIVIAQEYEAMLPNPLPEMPADG